MTVTSQKLDLDLVISQLERYEDFLRNELNKKMSGCTNGSNNQNSTVTDDAELERPGCSNNEE